jgi:carboxyl-terminal processing protease
MQELSPRVSLAVRGLSLAACVCLGIALGVSFERLRVTHASSPISNYTHDGRVLGQGQIPPADLAKDVDFRLFWEVWKDLQERYYEQPLKDKDLFYGALNGLAAGTGDPYTSFFEPQAAEEFTASIKGSFGGIGAEIGLKKDVLQIVAPLPDTPAARAGLLAGDLIVKIDGQDTSGMTVDQAVQKIRGEKGTKIMLSLYREKAKQPLFDVTIVRDVIRVSSVTSKMLPGGIAYVKIASFTEDSSRLFDQAVTTLLKQHPKGLVVDLRNDPGGLLDQAQRVTAAWVGDKIVVKERRQGKIDEELPGIGVARLKDMPTTVLVNQGSASASEIVAGALQDYGLATLVGTKTFGKGSVQEVRDFEDGSALKVTIYEWLTPHDRTIHKTGLEPDVVVEQTLEDYESKRDPVLDRAVGILTGAATSTPRAVPTSTTP